MLEEIDLFDVDVEPSDADAFDLDLDDFDLDAVIQNSSIPKRPTTRPQVRRRVTTQVAATKKPQVRRPIAKAETSTPNRKTEQSDVTEKTVQKPTPSIDIDKLVQQEQQKGISGFGKTVMSVGGKVTGVLGKAKQHIFRKNTKETTQAIEKEVNIPIIYIAIGLALFIGVFTLVSSLLINKYDGSRRATEFNLKYGQTYIINRIKLGDDITVKFKEYITTGEPSQTVTFKYNHKSVDDAYYRLFKYYLKEGDYVVYTDTHELSRILNPQELKQTDSTAEDLIEEDLSDETPIGDEEE